MVYEASVGPIPEEFAERALRIAAAALIAGGPWPEEMADAPAVMRYEEAISGMPEMPGQGLASAYEPVLRGEVSSAAQISGVLAALRELSAWAGCPLQQITPEQARAFLAHVTTTPGPFLRGRGNRSVSTRNRMLSWLRRFYAWAGPWVRENPFDGIPKLREPHPETIDYCTRSERAQILSAGDALERGDTIALWLAFYTGAREGEIYRYTWDDMLLKERRVVVRKAKNRRRRVLPMAAALHKRLTKVRRDDRRGPVVIRLDGFTSTRSQARHLIRAVRDAVDVPHVGWNAFRHTFGSLLAQKGVGIDKISAWMGNSPEVCRRHYAEFLPRGEADRDIDAL